MQTPSPFQIDSGHSISSSTRFDFDPSAVGEYIRELSQSTSGVSSDLSGTSRPRAQSNPTVRASDYQRRLYRKRKFESLVLGSLSIIPTTRRTITGSTCSRDTIVNSYRVDICHGCEFGPVSSNLKTAVESAMSEIRNGIVHSVTGFFDSRIANLNNMLL